MSKPRVSAKSRPFIAITMGDPGGIGPEVIVKALADPKLRNAADFVIFGIDLPLREAAARARIKPFWTVHPDEVRGSSVHVVQGIAVENRRYPRRAAAKNGAASLRFIRDALAAIDLNAKSGRHAAIVTAPICKEAWALAGQSRYQGHTELLADHFRAKRHAMMFVAPKLRVVLATTHEPISKVPKLLTRRLILDSIELGFEACKRLGLDDPRIAVCGLNPHAGEHGLLGIEDQRIISPAISSARRQGINASGPHPADTVFNAATRGAHDLVLAMYHDQGLIPIKLLAWDSAVNWTLGLPVIRTSPDHGTAFEIAGMNKANPGSMAAAIAFALRFVLV